MKSRRSSSTRASKKALTRLLQSVEHKVVTTTTTTVPTAAGVIVNTSAVVQGDDVADRSGRKIFIESVRLRLNQIATASHNCRFMLVRDRFNLGTVPAVTDILSSTTVSALPAADGLLQKRFQILLDHTLSYSSAGSLAATYDKTVKVNKPAYYTGSATTDEGSGLIWLLYISDAATASAIDIKVQTRFTDV